VCTIDHRAIVEEESREVRDARKQIQGLRSEIIIRNKELEMLLQYGKAMGGTSIIPQQAISFTEHISKKQLSTQPRISELVEKIESLEAFILDQSVPKKGRATGRATVTISANEDGLVQLTISYCASSNIEFI
jgi:hypothetical protein